MSLFINNEKAMIEPYTELPVMALAVVGFIVFIAVVTQSYTTYQEKSFIAGHYEDAITLAQKLGKDSILTGANHGVIDAGKLDKIKNDPAEIFQQYGSYYNFMFKVDSKSENREYNIVIRNPDAEDSKMGISASIPITIRLNDVEEQTGTLTVKIWEKK